MDGAKRGMKHLSNWLRLSAWRLFAAIFAIASAGALLQALFVDDASDRQDRSLNQIASLVSSGQVQLGAPDQMEWQSKSDPVSGVFVRQLAASPTAQTPPSESASAVLQGLGDGLHSITLEDTSWRVLIRTLTSSQRIVVGQRSAARDELFWDALEQMLIALLIAAPIVLLVMASRPLIRLRPVDDRHRDASRQPVSLSSVLPDEPHSTRVTLRHSLRLRLAMWLSGLILSVAALAAAYSFQEAFKDAQELQDDTLRQIASPVSSQAQAMELAQSLRQVMQSDPESRTLMQILAPQDESLPESPMTRPFDLSDLPDGLHTTTAGEQTWRVLIKTVAPTLRIAVGQQTTVRDEAAWDGALRTLAPMFVLIPVVLLALGLVLGRMFLPVTRLAKWLDERDVTDLRELPINGLPSEVEPFAVAINRLLGRVAQSMAMQRRFVADAAHELRSPLTALSLQAERLASSEMSSEATERVATLRDGMRRTRSLLDQLLTMARVMDSAPVAEGSVSVKTVFRTVLEGLMPLAEARGIDIGATTPDDVTLDVAEIDLQTLVRNLVDNGIRYTPPGGRVDLAITRQENGVILSVEDSGPGIPEAERKRVFDPFYRVLGNTALGSGLGLSIVRTIADRVGASVELTAANASDGTGLRVSVCFPMVRNASPAVAYRH